ncbi:IclR family transcriptional regulator [Oceaniglobus ichthyenteri]|uniref:IclR family transcriptional regulator n=1 Tax=Oceaniglobus ichthyenteri TaxID=2136177 RepID=UPI000D3A7C0E|nr:IclR family transcriptional regulator [Oceaniglobus ichthyenteri]
MNELSDANRQRLNAGTVAKAIEIIQAVTAGPHHCSTVTEIAERLNIPRPTANRLISNLIKLGMLKRDGGGTRIIEGDELVDLAGNVLTGAASRGPRHEVLRQLVIDLRETANVGTISNGQIVYVDRVEAAWPLAFRLDVGSRVPIHCSAIGKLLLSRMNDTQRRRYVDTLPLQRRTENSICDPELLIRELDRIRVTGVALDNEECFSGVIGIAVAIGEERTTPQMALALVAPSGRQTVEGMMEFVPEMRTAAARLAECYRG